MLTPAFELSQNDEFLIIFIKVPYAKVSETDIVFEDFDFKFYCKPYFLRLNLPGKVQYVEEPDVLYDVSSNTFTISLPKATPGECFERLDFLTQLLAPRRQSNLTPKIEVLGEVNSTDVGEFDWEIEQSIAEDNDFLICKEAKCGFANMYSASVFKLKEESSTLFDITDADKKSPLVRTQERSEMEVNNFSEEHYLADLYDDEEIQSLVKFKTEWDKLIDQKCSSSSESFENKVEFTTEEKERLRRLPNKEYLLEKSDIRTVLLGLLDIVYAFAYNKRTTEEENTVESAWNINKLSSTLSCLEIFSSVKAVVQSSVQRSLVYPLFRHWGLAMAILEDTKKILTLGRKYVLKCLLEIHSLFCTSDPRYILNDLYITDYCVWIQGKSCGSSTLKKLVDAVDQVHIRKEDLKLELIELEQAAELTQQEPCPSFPVVPNSVEALCSKMSSLNVKECTPCDISRSVHKTDSDESDSDDTNDSSTDSDDSHAEVKSHLHPPNLTKICDNKNK